MILGYPETLKKKKKITRNIILQIQWVHLNALLNWMKQWHESREARNHIFSLPIAHSQTKHLRYTKK